MKEVKIADKNIRIIKNTKKKRTSTKDIMMRNLKIYGH